MPREDTCFAHSSMPEPAGMESDVGYMQRDLKTDLDNKGGNTP